MKVLSIEEKKLALIACIRMLLAHLNAMVKNNEFWRYETTMLSFTFITVVATRA
jgi:hypothetical protein